TACADVKQIPPGIFDRFAAFAEQVSLRGIIDEEVALIIPAVYGNPSSQHSLGLSPEMLAEREIGLIRFFSRKGAKSQRNSVANLQARCLRADQVRFLRRPLIS